RSVATAWRRVLLAAFGFRLSLVVSRSYGFWRWRFGRRSFDRNLWGWPLGRLGTDRRFSGLGRGRRLFILFDRGFGGSVSGWSRFRIQFAIEVLLIGNEHARVAFFVLIDELLMMRH